MRNVSSPLGDRETGLGARFAARESADVGRGRDPFIFREPGTPSR